MSEEERFNRANKAALQRRKEVEGEAASSILYYETLDDEMDPPWLGDADMDDRTTPEDMAYVDELSEGMED